MRVKDLQKRAKVAFTKPLTTHLTRGKADFLCRGGHPSKYEPRRTGLNFV